MIVEINLLSKKRYELIDITEKVEKMVKDSAVKNGEVLIFIPHSTAGILLTENEEGLKEDWLEFFKKIVSGLNFSHNKIDDNADAHILSGLIGQQKILIIKDGKIVRGAWQNIFLVELDGPRNRKAIVKITGQL